MMVPLDTESGYFIVRTYSAGVFCGRIDYLHGRECRLLDARRIWRWEGAASLSQLSVEGSKNEDGCLFPVPVEWVLLTEVIEILPVTAKAKASIDRVKIWEAT